MTERIFGLVVTVALVGGVGSVLLFRAEPPLAALLLALFCAVVILSWVLLVFVDGYTCVSPAYSFKAELQYALFPAVAPAGYFTAVCIAALFDVERSMAIWGGVYVAVLTVAWNVVGEVWERHNLRYKALLALRGRSVREGP